MARGLQVQTLFIEPGNPWENGYVESFNGKLWDELLDREIFGSPKVHVGHFASLTLGGGSSMLVSQSMITPMSADAEWRQSLRIRPPAFRLENHACAP